MSLGLPCLLCDFFRQGVCNWCNSLIYQSSLPLKFVRNTIYFLLKKNVLVKACNTKISCRDSTWKTWNIYCYIQLLLHFLQLKFYDSIFLQLVFLNSSLLFNNWRSMTFGPRPSSCKVLGLDRYGSMKISPVSKVAPILSCRKKEAKIHRLLWTVSSSTV